MKYVLITPAHNEAASIQETLNSTVAQTLFPERWVILDDGSTDNTTEIVDPFAEQVSWIELLRCEQRVDRNFAGKVYTLGSLFSYGEKDYYLGGSPLWQVFRVMYRMAKRPVLIGGLALLAGYCWAALRRIKRPVSRELIRFHRQEQMKKLKTIILSLCKLKPVDNFHLATERE